MNGSFSTGWRIRSDSAAILPDAGRYRYTVSTWAIPIFHVVTRMDSYTPGIGRALWPILAREGVVAMVRRGLPFSMLDEVAAAVGVGRLAVAEVVGLPPTTLSRRRKSGGLTPTESDRLVRLARLVAMAYDMMQGDGKAARRWLKEPHELIEGEAPFERASTEVGGREVEQLIGRIRHGVFS